MFYSWGDYPAQVQYPNGSRLPHQVTPPVGYKLGQENQWLSSSSGPSGPSRGDQQAINLLAQCSTVGEIIQHKYNTLMAAGYLTRSHLLWAISWDRRTNGSHLVVDPVDPVGGINRPLIFWHNVLQLGKLSSTSIQ